ncbi:MAG: type 4a pilus biogenesis protein PilO [Candidatus Omnitrophica bacterium]|nr:type 4a pilus biogenesis protein PilO [Candidatus Omnitrophota bacterium]MDD5654615.1 type 4a pilus biogenesis protein PilO [Candidatus Omnitrophota bacterium]
MTIDLNTIMTKYRNTAFNIGLVLVALIVARAVYSNQYKKVVELRRDIGLETQKNDLFSELNTIEQKLAAYRQVYAKKEVSTIMNDITQAARDSDVRIVSIKPGEDQKQSGYSELSIDVNVGASDYHSLAKFINILENSSFLFIVKSFFIKPQILTPEIAKGKQDRLLVQATISTTTVQ